MTPWSAVQAEILFFFSFQGLAGHMGVATFDIGTPILDYYLIDGFQLPRRRSPPHIDQCPTCCLYMYTYLFSVPFFYSLVYCCCYFCIQYLNVKITVILLNLL